MRFVVISDTHNQHDKLELPKGDCIIHAGDMTSTGTVTEVFQFLDWFKRLNFKYKILIAGNHDFFFEDVDDFKTENVIYLNDSGIVLEDIHIWGSPIQPEYHNWAFNRNRGDDIRQHWKLIPKNTDLLITHGPPFGYLDTTNQFQRVGCVDLLKRVSEVNPRYHVFGHVHEAYGIKKNDKGTRFINASVLDANYKLANQPIGFDLV